jgi:predicted glycoside hydrolase/deacetylase ChbG (UPF0249 family)
MMADMRYLIVNADDFGQSLCVNEGIIEAHEYGIVTSASLMVRWPAAAEGAAYGRTHPRLSLGLHVDLGEWIFRDGNWSPLYEVISTTDPTATMRELVSQLCTFRRLVGGNPTHLDSHQHVHRHEPVHSALTQVARDLGVPLRQYSPYVRYCGDFYGQTGTGASLHEAISVDSLLRILSALPKGFTELSCHPGRTSDIVSMYCHERALEVKTLCDASIRQALDAEMIELISFSELQELRQE